MRTNKQQTGKTIVTVISIILLGVFTAWQLIKLRPSSPTQKTAAIPVDHKKNAMVITKIAQEYVEKLLNQSTNASNSCEQAAVGHRKYETGSYDILSGTDIKNSRICKINTKAKHGNVIVLTDSIYTNAGGDGGGSFYEPFTNDAGLNQWTLKTVRQDGEAVFDLENCDNGSCPGFSGGSLLLKTTGSSEIRNLYGHLEHEITPIFTGSDGLSASLTAGFRKFTNTASPASRHNVYMELYDSSKDEKTEIWRHAYSVGAGKFTAIKETSLLPANHTYDRFRISFELRAIKEGKSYVHPNIYIDEINLKAGAGKAQNWKLTSWKIVNQ